MANPNEVGAGWKQTAQSTGLKYLRFSLDLDKLMKATGGLTSGRISLSGFFKKGEKTNPNQPDLDLIYSPPSSSSGMRREQQQRRNPEPEPVSELTDEDIPW